MKSTEYREQLARTFINCLQEKQLSWKKEWKASNSRAPYNAVTGKRYKGINHLALGLTAMTKQYQDPRWATFKQIQDNEWKLKKGSKASVVEYWFPFDHEKKKALTWEEARLLPKEEASKVGLVSRYYYVFNAQEIEGIPALPEIPKNENVNHDKLVETISQNMGVPILFDGGDRAFYRPSEDKIHLPEKEYFSSTYAFNATALHELSHATGAPNRLNRSMGSTFGSSAYAYEELVAEMSSCFMAAELSVEQEMMHIDNHKAYVQGWIQAIQDKPEYLIKAVKDATECADYLAYKAELISEQEYYKGMEKGMDIKVEEERNSEKNILRDAYVSVSRGEGKSYLMPLEDYLEEKSYRYGFDSYEDLRKAGYNIDFPELLNKDGTPMVQGEVPKNTDAKIIEDIKRSGFQPNRNMVTKYQELDDAVGRHVGMEQICDWYKGECPDILKEQVKVIGDECKQQQLERTP